MKQKWHDDMVTVWVSCETRDRINTLRITEKQPTADAVFKMLLSAYKSWPYEAYKQWQTEAKKGKE